MTPSPVGEGWEGGLIYMKGQTLELDKRRKSMEGKLVIVSAPSGAGKTTIVRHLLDSGLNLAFSVSATTRKPRGKEKDGVDYFFLTIAEFRNKIENNEFVEWEEVYKDLLYGTLKSELERIRAKGSNVIFDVDAKGGINLKKNFGTKSIALFLMPPSVEELESRLIKRGTDNPEIISMRVNKAREEMELANQFDTVIINHHLDKAKQEALEIVTSFLER
jgi:guanylate kinase